MKATGTIDDIAVVSIIDATVGQYVHSIFLQDRCDVKREYMNANHVR